MKKLLIAGAVALLGCAGAGAQTALTNVDPAPGTAAFDYNTYWDIQVFFSSKISYEGATFAYNDEVVDLTSTYTDIIRDEDCIVLRISNPSLANNYVQQAVEAGASSFTVSILGVESNGEPVNANNMNNNMISVDNGTVSITYNIESPAKYLPDESTWPETFYEYWEPGDPDAMIVLVFSQPVIEVYEPSVIMAHAVPNSIVGGDDLVSYELEAEIVDGNVVIDLSGVHRPGNTKEVTVYITSVTCENGMPANMTNGVNLLQYLPYVNTAAPSEPGNPDNPDHPDDPNGIESIISDSNGVKAIYDLNGRKLKEGATGNGIYIIDGKKVVVR